MNAKRLIHITGMQPLAFKISQIEIVKDPCPMKLSYKEVEKVLGTSKAQSIISSRQASRRGSLDVSRVMENGEQNGYVQSAKTIQAVANESERD